MKKWITFFSQTGSEIVDLANSLYRWPDVIITNNTDLDSMHPKICNKITHTLNKEDAKTLHILNSVAEPDDLITLHGWLRIVPQNICEQYNIFNGHPGLINRYPELKGKDPVERVWDKINRYELVGSVIHKVTAEIDGGQILYHASESTADCRTYEDVCKVTRRASFRTWLEFAKDYLDLPG